MLKTPLFWVLVLILIGSFLFSENAHAQVAPNQNQLIPSAYWGQGYVISTSTSPSHKLGASLIDLAGSFITGILGVPNGGTGSSTLTGILKGKGTSAVGTAVPGTDYQAPITLTTTGTSGVATFIANTLNIPNYTSSGGGTGNVATSSAETNTYIPFWTSTGATPATLSGGVSGFAWNNALSKLTATNASTTNLSIGTLTGFLKGTSGLVSAVTSIVPADFSLTKGNFLVGNDAGVAQATSTIFIDSLGKVGIGSTTPWGLLSVNPNALGSGVPEFVVGSSTITHFAIAGNGYVGIGTSTPRDILSLSVPGGGDSPRVSLTNSTTGYGPSDGTFFGIANGNEFYVLNYEAAATRIFTNGTERLTIGATGLVGVGSSTPWAKLSVTNTGSGPSFVVEDSTSPDSSPFIIDASGLVGVGTTSPSAGLLSIGSTGGVSAYLAGSLGIGTTTPHGQFAIATPSGTNARITVQRNSITDTATIDFRSQSSAAWSVGMADGTGHNFGIRDISGSNNNLVVSISQDAPANTFNITKNILGVAAAGGVGIGTTSANNAGTVTAKLSVKGNGTGTAYNFMTTNSSDIALFNIQDNGFVGIGSTTPYAKLSISVPYAGNVNSGIAVGTDNGIYAGNFKVLSDASGNYRSALTRTQGGVESEVLSFGLNSSTNVGIGSTSPYAKLSVKGTGSTTGVNFQTTNSSDSPLFTILDSGNVGIATTSPYSKLSVTGTFAADVGLEQAFGVDSNGVVTFPHANGSGFAYLKAPTNRGFRFLSGATTLVDFPTSAASTLVLGYAGVQIGDSSSPGTSIYLNSIGASDLNLRAGDGNAARTADVIFSVKDNVEVARFTDGKFMGLGTSTPGSILSIGSSTDYINISNTATSTFAKGINLKGGCFAINDVCVGGTAFSNTLANGGTATTTFYAGGPVYSDGTKLTQSSSLLNWAWDEVNKRMGIGTSTPGSLLSLGGDLRIGAPSAGGTNGDLYINKLATAAGTFLAADAFGKVIATSTPSAINYQAFTADGTWTKPSGLTGNELVTIQMWGGGGSGGRTNGGANGGGGGGGGAACVTRTLKVSQLSSTETVTIGLGGTAVSGVAAGNAGGTTLFGTKFSAFGGGGGGGNGNNGGAGGGSWLAVGGTGGADGAAGGTIIGTFYGNGGVGAVGQNNIDEGGGGGGDMAAAGAFGGGRAKFGGGGGGAGNSDSTGSGGNGGASECGGGGGGGAAGQSSGSHGTGGAAPGSGGVGGAAGDTGTAGTAPGGGGGGSVLGDSGAGARGEVRVWITK